MLIYIFELTVLYSLLAQQHGSSDESICMEYVQIHKRSKFYKNSGLVKQMTIYMLTKQTLFYINFKYCLEFVQLQ